MLSSHKKSNYIPKIMIVCFATIVMLSLVSSLYSSSSPVSMSALPDVPKEGQPLMVTFDLNNPSLHDSYTDYELFANGELIMAGSTQLAAESSKQYQYTYKNPLQIGEQVNFVVKSKTNGEVSQQSLSLPMYPPQIYSSFVSMAAISPSMMSYMSLMTQYDKQLTPYSIPSVSVLFSLILIALLIFLELSASSTSGKMQRLNSLRVRFSRLSGILFVIFIGTIFTQMALIISHL